MRSSTRVWMCSKRASHLWRKRSNWRKRQFRGQAMQDTATKSESVANQLKDKKLFREACYIDGGWVQAKSGGTVQVDNPATGEIIGSVPKLGAVETREAIEAANRAFPAWSKKTGKERAIVLRK